MRVFLLHPDDDFHGSWTRQHWDSVIDLGRAPKSFYDERSAALGCPVFSVFDLAVEVEDMQVWRNLLQPGMGWVVDNFGIDWWDVIGLMLQPELQDVRLALRLAEKLRGCRTLTATRPSMTADVLRLQLGIPLQFLQQGVRERLVPSILRRSAVAAANLSFVQFRQVVYDKYDPHYRWRRKFAGSPAQSSKWKSKSQPVVLLPTAYSNVTKTALGYAGTLPDKKFLLVVARESAAVSPVPANVQTARLAGFATKKCDRDELQKLEICWTQMEQSLQAHPAFRLPVHLEILKQGPHWLRWGLGVRDAWLQVFETHSVVGCLSADDSNPYTRIPLLLAAERKIPAVACHHGALDCRMAHKNLRFSNYLAKGEMEHDYLERVCGVDTSRVRIGAASPPRENGSVWSEQAPWITFFTEPYGADFWRVEPIYRELLPRLCAAARSSGKTVVLKLHPFETARQRRRLLARTLSEADRKLVSVTDAPLSHEIFQKTWCAVTVESTVACECASVGIPVFLCGWLRHAYSGYALQYVRFGVGRMLESPDELLRIPEMLGAVMPSADTARRLVQAISPEVLSEVFAFNAACLDR